MAATGASTLPDGRGRSLRMTPCDDPSVAVNVLVHFAVLGVLAWGSGQPFLSSESRTLGVPARHRRTAACGGPNHVVVGHAVVCGRLAYVVLEDGLVVTDGFDAGEPLSVRSHASPRDGARSTDYSTGVPAGW